MLGGEGSGEGPFVTEESREHPGEIRRDNGEGEFDSVDGFITIYKKILNMW